MDHTESLGCSDGAARLEKARTNPETVMRLEAIAIGKNPPEDVNVVIEVPIGGEPI